MHFISKNGNIFHKCQRRSINVQFFFRTKILSFKVKILAKSTTDRHTLIGNYLTVIMILALRGCGASSPAKFPSVDPSKFRQNQFRKKFSVSIKVLYALNSSRKKVSKYIFHGTPCMNVLCCCFCRVFSLQKSWLKTGGRVQDRGLKTEQEAVNFKALWPKKACQVKVIDKIVIKSSPNGLVAPSIALLSKRKIDLFDFILKLQPSPT